MDARLLSMVSDQEAEVFGWRCSAAPHTDVPADVESSVVRSVRKLLINDVAVPFLFNLKTSNLVNFPLFSSLSF